MRLIDRKKGDPAGWKDTLTVEMTGWELQVLVNSMTYIDAGYPCFDSVELGFSQEDAEAVRNALDKIDEAVAV